MGINSVLFCTILMIIGVLMGTYLACHEEEEYKNIFKEKKNHLFMWFFAFIIWALLILNLKALNGQICYFLFLIGGILAPSAIIDFRIQELPDSNNGISAILFLLVYSLFFKEMINEDVFLLAMPICVFLCVLPFFGGFGFGDTKLICPMIVFWSFFGWEKLLDFAMAIILAAFVYIIPLVIKNAIQHKSLQGIKFAFGPYIILGFYLTFLLSI